MTRPERSAIAASRREIARSLRQAGKTWAEVGRHLGVTRARAIEIAALKPAPVRPVVTWRGTIAEYIAMRIRRLEGA